MSRKKRLVPNIGYLVQFDLFGLGFDEVIGISDVSVPLTSSRCADTQNELNVLMSRRSFKLSSAKNNVSNLVLCSWPNFNKQGTLFLFVPTYVSLLGKGHSFSLATRKESMNLTPTLVCGIAARKLCFSILKRVSLLACGSQLGFIKIGSAILEILIEDRYLCCAFSFEVRISN